MIEFLIEKVVLPLTVIIVIGLVLILPVVLYQNYKSEKICLIKKEFECTLSHKETVLQPTFVGNTTILVPLTNIICDQYSKIK